MGPMAFRPVDSANVSCTRGAFLNPACWSIGLVRASAWPCFRLAMACRLVRAVTWVPSRACRVVLCLVRAVSCVPPRACRLALPVSCVPSRGCRLGRAVRVPAVSCRPSRAWHLLPSVSCVPPRARRLVRAVTCGRARAFLALCRVSVLWAPLSSMW